MTDNRDSIKRQVRALAKRGHSIREISDKTGVTKSTVHRWTKSVLPAHSAPSKVEAPTPGETTDLNTLEGLQSEQARLYAALATEGFDRSLALRISIVSKRLSALQESGCAEHFKLSDLKRICDGINATWLRQLEIVERDLLQTGCADAQFLLDRAIEKTRVELGSVT